MKTRIMCIIMAICICFGSINTYKTSASAAQYYTGGLETWAATKIITTLYHLAGVVFDKASELSIWDGGKLDVEQLVTNVETYSFTLAYGLKELILQGVAGNSTLNIRRSWWNEWKEYVREEYGTDTSQSSVIGGLTSKIDVPQLIAGDRSTTSYTFTNYVNYSFYVTFDRNMYVIGVPVRANTSSTVYYRPYYLYYIPISKVTSDGSSALYNGMDYHNITGGTTGQATPQLVQIGDIGYVLRCVQTYTYPISTITTDGNKYILEEQPYTIGMNVTPIDQLVVQIVQKLRSGEGLTEQTEVTGKPMAGVDGGTATQIGQDVLGLGNTATQDGDDVILGGDIAISLPADVVLEDILKKLAEGTATYAELVEALGAVAVATEDTTAEDVEEKEKTIAIPAPTGLYTVSLNDLFPFCIPFDLYDLIKVFVAAPVAPSATITLPVGYNGSTFTWEEYEISLEQFDAVAQVVRVFEYVLFCVGLMMITRKLIEG